MNFRGYCLEFFFRSQKGHGHGPHRGLFMWLPSPEGRYVWDLLAVDAATEEELEAAEEELDEERTAAEEELAAGQMVEDQIEAADVDAEVGAQELWRREQVREHDQQQLELMPALRHSTEQLEQLASAARAGGTAKVDGHKA